jgi:hypothetical protein
LDQTVYVENLPGAGGNRDRPGRTRCADGYVGRGSSGVDDQSHLYGRPG